jgi:hypothetical protein
MNNHYTHSAMLLGWNPKNTKQRLILGVLKFDDGVLRASFTNMINAEQDAYDLAVGEIDAGRSVYEWMLKMDS